MSFVLIFNWLLGIFFAFIVSPGTWIGQQHLTNLHIWVAFLQGGFMALFPAYLAWFHSGAPVTRHVIAMSQCLFASLFVHLKKREEELKHISIILGLSLSSHSIGTGRLS